MHLRQCVLCHCKFAVLVTTLVAMLGLLWLPCVAVLSILMFLVLNIVHDKSFLMTFVHAVVLALLAWLVWTIFVYPHYVSPLRHLPTPGGNHWLWGHGLKLMREPQGQASREW